MVNEIDLVKKLEGAGVQRKQAEAHVKTMAEYSNSNLATKKDTAAIHHEAKELRGEINSIGVEIKSIKYAIAQIQERIERIELRLDKLETKFDRLEDKFDRMEAKIDAKIEAAINKVVVKVFMMNVGFITAVGVVNKLFFS